MSSEYNNAGVGNSCSYATLQHYNSVSSGSMRLPPQHNVPGQYIVPVWGAPGYNTLTHGQKVGSCNGFFNIESAYGKNANHCNTKYITTLCGAQPQHGQHHRPS